MIAWPRDTDFVDGVTIIVEYLSKISSHYPDASASLNETSYSLDPPKGNRAVGERREYEVMDDDDDLSEDEDSHDGKEEKEMSGFYNLIAHQTEQCLAVLGNLVDGPCLENQLVVCGSEALELISKVLEHTAVQRADILVNKYDDKLKEIPKLNQYNGKINVLQKATTLLTALLEGSPNKTIQIIF